VPPLSRPATRLHGGITQKPTADLSSQVHDVATYTELLQCCCIVQGLNLPLWNHSVLLTFIHSFSSLSHDRSKASPKASSPHSAI
jgi:hypothetical protein